MYDVEKLIKTVSDKEGAHIDKIVDSEGIYTGSQENVVAQATNSDAYVRSRLVRFGPFSYSHVVVILVSRYLVTIVQESLKREKGQVQSFKKQMTLNPDSVSRTRERIDIIMNCPKIGKIDGFPLLVRPERLVLRPPIKLGLSSFEDEQARVNNLPRYGESYIGAPRK